MRRFVFVALGLVVVVTIHFDWHLARPTHHRLSLGWDQHWLFAAIAFGLVGWIVARVWPAQAWSRAGLIAAFGIILAQGIEPIAEVALYRHQLGYPDELARWTAFFTCLAAGLPTYVVALWLCRPRMSRRRPRSLAPAA